MTIRKSACMVGRCVDWQPAYLRPIIDEKKCTARTASEFAEATQLFLKNRRTAGTKVVCKRRSDIRGDELVILEHSINQALTFISPVSYFIFARFLAKTRCRQPNYRKHALRKKCKEELSVENETRIKNIPLNRGWFSVPFDCILYACINT